ncbi:HTH_Tnp_Tc3_2 domain-containing protein [Trichonephila clavipes]|nr:HTH_Tnp_Tc3_2 domain-containing protein [Trichonephila clavipes]
MIMWHAKNSLSVRLAYVLSAKLNSYVQFASSELRYLPLGKKLGVKITCGFGDRLHGEALKSDTSSWGMYFVCKVSTTTQQPKLRDVPKYQIWKEINEVIKMVCIVLCGFVLCWSPMQVTILYAEFWHSASQYGELPYWFEGFQYFSMFLAYFNSALNPLLYGGLNNNFRQSFCNVLKCEYARQPRRPRTRKTTRREDRRIVRQALVDPTVTRSTTRADVGVAIVPQTISRHLAEANLKSKRPFRALPLTPEHRQLRLQ